MAQGPYDHPSYLTRQMVHIGKTTAGASGTSFRTTFPSNMRIRNVSACVITAGTVGTAAAAGIIIQNGTTALGTIAVTTNTVGYAGTSGDLNATLTNGSPLTIVNGTDATFAVDVSAEMHIDPAGSWS